jgi:peptidoglycan/xylan/chitin deacetylase (PgdA/CDA1 family)
MVEQKRFEADLLPQMAAWDGFRPTPMMTRSAIASIAAVHEIGAHSYEHASMAFETDDYVRADARRCRHWFREVLGEDPTIYAFPNGAYRPVQVDIVRQAGFETVLLVDEDFSHCESTVHKRFGIYGAGLRELKFRAVGGRRRPSRRAAR